MADSRIKDVSTLLSAFFEDGTGRRGGQYAEFFSSWRRIAGERLAAHSKVQDIERGILLVEAEHPGWIQLLQLRQAEIVANVRSLFPELEIRGISFRLKRESGAAGTAGPDAPQAGVARPGPFGPGGRAADESSSGRHEEEIHSLDDIQDPELRGLLGELKKTIVDGEK